MSKGFSVCLVINWDINICLSFIVCTPLGFARLFTVLGQYVVKPQVRDL